MAECSHSVHSLRRLPILAGQLLSDFFQLLLTTAGIIWLAPASAPVTRVIATAAIGLPLITQSTLAERDLRVRSHAGALSRFYLDAMLHLNQLRQENCVGRSGYSTSESIVDR
jgi:ATP-binding cassette subfamily B protein